MKRFLILYIIIFFWGCYSSSFQQKANVPAINQRILNDEVLSFITPGKKEFKLTIKNIDSQYLEGSGKMRKNSVSQWKDYEGSIPIDSVNILSFSEKDGGKSLLINAVVLTLLVKGLQAIQGPNNPTVELVYPGSSCPYIYSWRGNHYELEGEAFGTALGKAREMTTTTVLPNLNIEEENLRVQIKNERPETHFINNIALQAVEVDQDAVVLADNNQDLWPVYKSQEPQSAIDRTGKNILSKIGDKDNLYWESDLEHYSTYSDFEDVIEVTFHRPPESQNGSLIIRAINTYFANMAFEKLMEFLGDQSLPFMHDIENDQEVIQLLHDWTIESSLKVSVWNGSSWEPCGLLYPEANVTPFSRLVRLNIPADIGNTVKLRLTTLTDVWKIDAVSLDWTEVKKLDKMAIPLLFVDGQLSKNQIGLIQEKDDQYAHLLPSQKIDLTYEKLSAPTGKKICYALDVGGYLYEWLPEKNSTSLFSGFGDVINNDKIEFTKFLLRNKSLLLPPLYAEWLSEKQKK